MTEVTNADVTPEDRELLAKEYEREGSPMTAFRVRHGNEWPWERTALRAIPAARQQERERMKVEPCVVEWHRPEEWVPSPRGDGVDRLIIIDCGSYRNTCWADHSLPSETRAWAEMPAPPSWAAQPIPPAAADRADRDEEPALPHEKPQNVAAEGRGDDDGAPGPWERALEAIVDESERDARSKAIGKALRLLRSRIPGGPADWTEFDEALREIGG